MTQITRREVLSLAAAGVALAAAPAGAAEPWTEGKHYSRVEQPPQGVVAAVTEIFSYGCPACNAFAPYMQSIEKKLPPNSTDYLPASWIPQENWPLFQRAYLTAKALGVARKAHDAMFNAVWTTGELGITDPKTRRVRSPLPGIQEVAAFYQRVAGVPAAKFIETSKSFSIDTEARRTDALIKQYRAESTPTLIVNGKYRFEPRLAGTPEKAVELALWLKAR
jgi:thiol:disulfide interchange protein DsbA